MWLCKAPRVLSYGPAGTGKTFANLHKINLCALKYPRMRGLIVREVKADLGEILKEFEEYVMHNRACPAHNGEGPCRPPCPGRKIKKIGGERNHRQRYEYPNGSEIVVGGMDSGDRVMGPSYDMIVVIEGTQVSETNTTKLASRLRNNKMPYRQLLVDCNPRHPQHHLWAGANKVPPLYVAFKSSHKDNPQYWDAKANDWTPLGREYVLGTLAGFTGVERAWFYEGNWQAALGVVYPGFDQNTHVIKTDGGDKPFHIPSEWRRLRAIDFGIKNPFSCLWIAVDPDDRMYVYRELYMTGRIVEDHAAQINLLSAGEKIEATIADPADAEGRATLARHGIQTVPGQNAIVAGIQKVTARLRPRKDGKPGLYLVDTSLVEMDSTLSAKKHPIRLRDEFDSYSYPEEKPDAPRSDREEPLDKYNHAMSALRYAVVYLDGLDDAIRAFPEATTHKIKATIRPDLFRGTLEWVMSRDRDAMIRSRKPCLFLEDNDAGPWKFWCGIDEDPVTKTFRPLQTATYSIGSSLIQTPQGYRLAVCVSRKETREQVAEAVIEDTTPEEAARLLAALGYWFGGHEGTGIAFNIWEGNVPGTVMGRQIIRLGYPWLYYHSDTDKRNAKPTDKYGWKATDERAERLMIECRRSLATGIYSMRGEETATACERMVLYESGGMGPWDAKDNRADDTSVTRAQAVALALSVYGLDQCSACNPPKRVPVRGTTAYEEARLDREADKDKNRLW